MFNCIPAPMSPANLSVRTGRNAERSAERPALAATANAPRHEPPGFDLFPRRRLDGFQLMFEVRSLRVQCTSWLFRFHHFSPTISTGHVVIGATSTSQPFDVGIPVPSVSEPMSRQVGGP